MWRIRKEVRFEMAHRLMSSYSKKCQNLHGHSYVMEVILEGNKLNQDGMILDFGKLKEIICQLTENIDHAVMLNNEDELGKIFCDNQGGCIKVKYNPTAEMMAWDFTTFFWANLSNLESIDRITVRLHETATGWAEYQMSREEFNELSTESEDKEN